MMSKINIKPFFRFSQVRIVNQRVLDDLSMVWIKAVPDKRYIPICSECGTKSRSIHSYETRIVRDINMFKNKEGRGLTFWHCHLTLYELGRWSGLDF